MKTEHIVLGAAAIGAVGYLALRNKKAEGGDTATEMAAAQKELDDAKGTVNAAGAAGGAMSGKRTVYLRGLRGDSDIAAAELDNATVAALLAVNDAEVAVKKAKASALNDYIKLLTEGKLIEDYDLEIRVKTRSLYFEKATEWFYELQFQPAMQYVFMRDIFHVQEYNNGLEGFRDMMVRETTNGIFSKNDIADLGSYLNAYNHVVDRLSSIFDESNPQMTTPEEVNSKLEVINAVYYNTMREFSKAFAEDTLQSKTGEISAKYMVLARLLFKIQELQNELDEWLVIAVFIERARGDSRAYDPEKAQRKLLQELSSRSGISIETYSEKIATTGAAIKPVEMELQAVKAVNDATPACVACISAAQLAKLMAATLLKKAA
jgi:hypothetical protein